MARRTVSNQDITDWAKARSESALEKGKTANYLPRFAERDASEVVRHASIHLQVPEPVARSASRLIATKLQEAGVPLKAFHGVPVRDWHLTLGWVKPGVDAADDQAIITEANELRGELTEVAKELPQTELVINGVVILDKQIMVTYDADSWNRVFGVMETLRTNAPHFAEGGYSLEKSPLDGGQILQSTALMVTEETDIAPIYEALKDWLPGGHMKPISFTVDQVALVVHEFSPDNIFRRTQDLVRVPLVAQEVAAPTQELGPSL